MQLKSNVSWQMLCRFWSRTSPHSGPHTLLMRDTCLLVLLVLVWAHCRAQTWVAEGPGPNRLGQVENIKDGEVTGAIKAVAPHPTDRNIIYVGTVNGGVWKTTNAMTGAPNWRHQTDDDRSLSIGALEFDPTDSRHQTLVAGTGRFSSFGDGGARIGILRTTNGGKRWSTIDGDGTLSGLNISGIAPRGKVIVLSVNDADNPVNVGIWRTRDGGTLWRQVSNVPGTGLPAGAAACIASDPTNRARLFTNAGYSGLYRSTNFGETWIKVSNAALDSLISHADNVKISVGTNSNVYVAVDVDGTLGGVFRSPDGGTTWTAMDLPGTDEGGAHPGRQGGNHLSISADPHYGSVVYIGGDRQPSKFVNGQESDSPKWPNSIGAWAYSGRLFRGDASKPAGHQWVHLTHSNQLGAAGGGTASSSAPHGDSRGMAFAADGELIEVDDGGIYRRTDPRTNQGDWFSLNGDIQATEFHAVAWDANSHVVVGGAQDTGTPAQWPRSATPWQSISTSDGGVVAVDSSSFQGYSVRYSSCYSLLNFRRQVWDSGNVIQSEEFPQLAVLDNGAALKPQFYSPIRVNAAAPTRLIIGAANSVYESLDQGDTVREIGPGIVANDTGSNAVTYGAKDNPDTLYVGAGEQLFIRMAASPAPMQASATYTGGYVVSVAVDPNQSKSAFVVGANGVFRTIDAGASTWTDITGNLMSSHPGALRSIAYNPNELNGEVVVGTDQGVFAARGPAFTTWGRMGSGLPNAPVYQIEYSALDRIYLAGTLGRGAWTYKLMSHAMLSDKLPDAKGAPHLASGNESKQLASEERPEESLQTPSTSAEVHDRSSFNLGIGVIVDKIRGRIYAMSVDGGINAVDLSRGKHIWDTKAADKPIGLASDRIVCQAEAPEHSNDLKVVALDPVTGDKISTASVTLPQGIRPTVAGSFKGDFVATADAADGNAVVSWQFVRRPVQGLAPRTKATLSEPRRVQADAPIEPQRGSFRMNLATGAVSPVSAADASPGQLGQQPDLGTAGRLDTIGRNQFLSADQQSILVSTKESGGTGPPSYRLTIYDRESKTRLGELKSPFSVFSFFVSGTLIIHESPRYSERVGGTLVVRPRRIIAVDLKTGTERWTVEVPDTNYRGSFPP
jgi:hypothetical protein